MSSASAAENVLDSLFPRPKSVKVLRGVPLTFPTGKTAIVIGDKASEPEQYAAEALQKWVSYWHSQQWQIVKESSIPKDAAAYATVAWLANRNPVTVLPSVASLTSLRATARPSRADRAFLGVANPLLDGPDDRYTSLAQTARQVRTCAAAASLGLYR